MKAFKIEPSAGSHIRDVLAGAVSLAITKRRPVAFTFNDEQFTVRPTDSYRTACARWKEQTGNEIRTAEEEASEATRNLEELRTKQAAAIAEAKVQTEQEMRDAAVPWPQTPEELTAYIATLVDRPHDYGTCVHAMSMAATAAFNYVAHALGTTGFQSSCADMDILRRTRGLEWGRILDYSKLLYPQYCSDEHFPTWRGIIEANKEKFADEARKELANGDHAAGAVTEHWRWLASLSQSEVTP